MMNIIYMEIIKQQIKLRFYYIMCKYCELLKGGFIIKECCKNCNYLDYYDWYFCSIEQVSNKGNKTEIDYFINDIESEKCEMFSKRYDKFWLTNEGEF